MLATLLVLLGMILVCLVAYSVIALNTETIRAMNEQTYRELQLLAYALKRLDKKELLENFKRASKFSIDCKHKLSSKKPVRALFSLLAARDLLKQLTHEVLDKRASW